MMNRSANRQRNLGPGRLALQGYDPVAYQISGRAVPGLPELTLPYRGATYRFATPANRDLFGREPKRFQPAYGGWCATAMAEGRKVGVDPESFEVSNGRLFLFYRSRGWDARATWVSGNTAALERQADLWWDRIQAGGLGRAARLLSWTLQLVAAAILFQTLFFKFTGAEESVWIFTTLGMEPWGRIGSGIAELIACVLLLVPRTVAAGALLSLGVISGAIMSHLTRLGIVVQDDGGLLFALALVVFAASAAVLLIRRHEIPVVGRRLFGAPSGSRGGVRQAGAAAPGGPMSCAVGGGDDGRRRVLILGGGFGGVYTALELEKRLERDDVEVTLVNRDNFFLFTPMLHEVAASDLDLTNIVSPVRQMLRKVRFFQGDVERLDLHARRVTLSHGSDGHTHEVPYDQLVIALGSITNFYGLPGLAQGALTIRTLGDAMHLRNRVIAALEEADTECAGPAREPLLTFVVAGGGFAGVETIASLNDFVREALPCYPGLTEEDLRVVLVHSGPQILPELGEELGEYARRKLAARGVEIHTGRRVAGLDGDGVRFADGLSIPTRTLVWTAGTSPHPLLASLPCAKDRGRIVVDENLQVPGFPGVWALGDCAMVPDRRTGKACPPTAQHALREGRVAARNLLASLEGGSLKPFDFATLGQLATIGRRAGVARVFGLTFSGFAAWWLWRTIYLGKLPRLEKKIRVALDWTLDLFFSKDLVQFLTDRAPVMTEQPAAREPAAEVAAAASPSAIPVSGRLR